MTIKEKENLIMDWLSNHSILDKLPEQITSDDLFRFINGYLMEPDWKFYE